MDGYMKLFLRTGSPVLYTMAKKKERSAQN